MNRPIPSGAPLRALGGTEAVREISRAGEPSVPAQAWRRWLPGHSSPALEKLRRKIARNLGMGLKPFLSKGVRFAKSTIVTRYLMRGVNVLGVGVRIEGLAPKIENLRGNIILGDDIMFAAPRTAIYLGVEPDATLSIGDESWINDGVWFGCTKRISLGRRVLLGPGVRILDSNYHDLIERWKRPPGRPVTIDDDVWIASDAIILPGVTIGRGAVVGAKSVVREDVAPYTVVAGSPARLVKTLDPQLFERARASCEEGS